MDWCSVVWENHHMVNLDRPKGKKYAGSTSIDPMGHQGTCDEKESEIGLGDF